MATTPEQRFHQALAAADSVPSASQSYDRPLLLRLVYEQAVSDGCRQKLVSSFFDHLKPQEDGSSDDTAAVVAFADYLVDGLFLPLKAIAAKRTTTSSVCPSCSSSLPSTDQPVTVDHASPEPIYIFPPSPMTRSDELSSSGETAAALLAMLDDHALPLLRGDAGHAPHNTVCLRPESSALFRHFHAIVETDSPPSVYRLVGLDGDDHGTVSRVESASLPLLALHAAIARILHDSGAGRYIDSILDDSAVEDLHRDGMANVGRLMQLRLDGWWDGAGNRRDVTGIWIDDTPFTEAVV